MSRLTSALAVALIAYGLPAQPAQYAGIGRPATPAEIAAWDIDVRPDFKGLPPGSGSVAKGQQVWESRCAGCHGIFGESNEVFTPIVGGTTAADIETGRVKTLVTGDVSRTTLMKLASISTLWDYIRRAMPWNAPKSLSTEEVYAVVAYILNLGDIVPADFVLSDRNMGEVQQRLPNRNGLTQDHGLGQVKGKADVRNIACMKDCPIEATVGSSIPAHAQGDHGNLADQHRTVGPTRGAATVAAKGPDSTKAPQAMATAAAGTSAADLAKRKACLSCHGVERALVGPALKDVASRYRGDDGAEARLIQKLNRGGGGVWGPMPMPPNPDLSPDDARTLIRWVLSGAV